jgi:hypothetical protein
VPACAQLLLGDEGSLGRSGNAFSVLIILRLDSGIHLIEDDLAFRRRHHSLSCG